MNRGVPVDDCIPEVNPFDPQVANAAPQSSQSPADSPSENARSKLKQQLLSKYRSKRNLNVFEPKMTPKHIKKLRARNRTSFADLKNVLPTQAKLLSSCVVKSPNLSIVVLNQLAARDAPINIKKISIKMSTFHLFVRKQLVGAAQCCSVSPASQQSMLHRDIFIGYDKGTSTQTWFLGEKDFCKNFYARARGKADINRKKSKGFYFGESYLHAVDTEMKFIANKNEDRLNRNQICVWIHIIKSLTNFASKCSKIYAPLQRLFWSVGTECIVVAL